MKWLQHCLYCNHPLYRLGDGMLKCSRCRKKVSPERVNKILTLLACFADDENAHRVSQRLSLSYVSVQRYFEQFRRHCAQICETEYESLRHQPCEYEEYYYLERSKRQRESAVFDAKNFLTFDYGNHIYTIVMPSLHQYRDQFIEDNLANLYTSEFARFRRKSRIIKVSSRYNTITRFWNYFEAAVLRYKGITAEAFPLFLKEAEFKFNHEARQRAPLLEAAYFGRSLR